MFLLPLFLVCCADPPSSLAPPSPPDPGHDFDPDTTGSIAGLVRWHGTPPKVEPLRSVDEPLSDRPALPARDWPNPNTPSLGNVVVLLRGVDPHKARPWHHPAVRVELREQTYRVRQGASEGHIGFVRAGDPVEFVSLDDRLHVARVRGAAFFSLHLPRPNAPRSRPLPRPGLVELTSGSGYFWMRAYLFVSDHPYLTRLDSAGHFRIDGVPPGGYDVVAWHPNWQVSEQYRNPDLFRIQQVHYAAPIESVRRVRVTAGQETEANLSLDPSQNLDLP
jgi:hypothetical protein